MRAPNWLRNHSRGIFQALIFLYLLLWAFGTGALAEDGGLNLLEVIGSGVTLLVALLLIVGRMWGSSTRSAVEDGPTAPVVRTASVVPFPVRRRFSQSPPTLYRTGDLIPAPIPMQSRRAPAEPDTEVDLFAPVDPNDVLRNVMRENTGDYPPVWSDWEEAT